MEKTRSLLWFAFLLLLLTSLVSAGSQSRGRGNSNDQETETDGSEELTVPHLKRDQKDKRKDKENCYLLQLSEDAPPGLMKQIIDSTADADEASEFANLRRPVISRCGISENKLKGLLKNPFILQVEDDASVSVVEYWNRDRVNQREVPLDGQFNALATGAGTDIYVMDTGVRADHVELAGRVTPGMNFVDDGKDANEKCNYHGTFVAAVAAGTTVGIAKEATVIPVRVLDCTGTGSWTSVTKGFSWLRTQAGGKPSVINLSFAGPYSSIIDDIVDDLVDLGFHIAAAAGNGPQDACNLSPGRASKPVTVGATDEQDKLASFSNYGSCVDLQAPGNNIVSAYAPPLANNEYSSSSGTSFATPMVAGAMALKLQEAPTLSPAAMKAFLTSTATAGALQNMRADTANLLLYIPSAASSSIPISSPGLTGTCPEQQVQAGLVTGSPGYPVDTTCTIQQILELLPPESGCSVPAGCRFIICENPLPQESFTTVDQATCA